MPSQDTHFERRRRRYPSSRDKCEDLPLADTASDDSSILGTCEEACPYCADSCDDESCRSCAKKTCLEVEPTCPPRTVVGPCYTLCQVRKHCTEQSAWIVAGKDIYDVTSYISRHPGGAQSILRKTGGAMDCTEDLQFHSKAGRKQWHRYKVGTLVPCPGDAQNEREEKPWWVFWGQ
jgi:hypothetical protein